MQSVLITASDLYLTKLLCIIKLYIYNTYISDNDAKRQFDENNSTLTKNTFVCIPASQYNMSHTSTRFTYTNEYTNDLQARSSVCIIKEMFEV